MKGTITILKSRIIQNLSYPYSAVLIGGHFRKGSSALVGESILAEGVRVES
jgi:hypothetical protein